MYTATYEKRGGHIINLFNLIYFFKDFNFQKKHLICSKNKKKYFLLLALAYMQRY
jgi:hypothetical protein